MRITGTLSFATKACMHCIYVCKYLTARKLHRRRIMKGCSGLSKHYTSSFANRTIDISWTWHSHNIFTIIVTNLLTILLNARTAKHDAILNSIVKCLVHKSNGNVSIHIAYHSTTWTKDTAFFQACTRVKCKFYNTTTLYTNNVILK